MSGERNDRPAWLRLSGMGFEFAAAIVGFVLVGYWVDRHYGSAPKGVLIGAALGIIGGGYNMLRTALQASRQANREEKEDGEK